MSDEPPELRDLVPHLTKPSISDAEQRQLYEAAMRGEHLPRRAPWIIAGGGGNDVIICCPGCGSEQPLGAWRGPRACDGCGVTRRVP